MNQNYSRRRRRIRGLSLSAPAITDEQSGTILSDSAAISALVNPGNAETTVTIEYGETIEYGSTISATESPLAIGNSNESITASLTELTAETTYHWRVVAINSEGTTNGEDQTFDTIAG